MAYSEPQSTHPNRHTPRTTHTRQRPAPEHPPPATSGACKRPSHNPPAEPFTAHGANQRPHLYTAHTRATHTTHNTQRPMHQHHSIPQQHPRTPTHTKAAPHTQHQHNHNHSPPFACVACLKSLTCGNKALTGGLPQAARPEKRICVCCCVVAYCVVGGAVLVRNV